MKGYSADLLNFWHVPVATDAIAVDAFCNFCVQQVLLGAPTGPADA